MTSGEFPELKWMSPGERERYIQEQLRKKRIERLKETKRQFSSWERGETRDYASEKRKYDKAQKKPMSCDEIAKIKLEIASLKANLEQRRANIGCAHEAAISDAEKEEQAIPIREQQAREQAEVENQRFKQALTEQRANDPRIPARKRAELLMKAKNDANEREDVELRKFKRFKEKQRIEEAKAAQVEKEEEESRLRPKLRKEDYARTFFHAGVGVIPVNNGANEYKALLQAGEEAREKERQENEAEARRFNTQATRARKTDKGRDDLERELSEIAAMETRAALEFLRSH